MRGFSPLRLEGRGVGRSSVMNLAHTGATHSPLGWDTLVHSKPACSDTSVSPGASFPMCSRDFQYWGSHTTLTRRGGKTSSPLNFSRHGSVLHLGWWQLWLRPIRKRWRKRSEWDLSTLPLFALVNGTVVCSSCANPKYFQSNDSDDFLPMEKKNPPIKPNTHEASPSPWLYFHRVIFEQQCTFIVLVFRYSFWNIGIQLKAGIIYNVTPGNFA